MPFDLPSFDIKEWVADQVGLGGKTEADRLMLKYFLMKGLYDTGEQAVDRFFPSELEKLQGENLRLQNAKMRHEFPMMDDDDLDRDGAIEYLLGDKAARPKVKFLETMAVPSNAAVADNEFFKLGRKIPHDARSIATKLFLRR